MDQLSEPRQSWAAPSNPMPICLIGAGGIMSGGHAWEKLRAGASLVQIYSGMVYEGPGLAIKINRYLSQRIRREGLTHIRDVTGTGAKEWAEL